MARAAGSRKAWFRLPPGFVRAMLAGHSALGLVFAAAIYLVCFSGTVAVYVNELERWENPSAPHVETAVPEAVDRAIDETLELTPDTEHLIVSLPSAAMPRLGLRADREGGAVDEYYADAEGRVVGEALAPLTEFVARLHINLHLPSSWGVFIVGMTGVAILSSLISGLLAHPRIFRDAFRFRRGGSKHLQEADLHNRIGVWGLPFHIVISLTGALLGLTTIIVGALAFAFFDGDTSRAYSLFLPQYPAEDTRSEPVPEVAPFIERVERAEPDAVVEQVVIEHPGESGQGILINTDRPGSVAAGGSYLFDGSGRIVDSDPSAAMTVGAGIVQAIGDLHFGWFGGWPLKLAYALLGAGLTVVTVTGVNIWLVRRRAKGSPVPGCERFTAAFVWSQPVAFVGAALSAVADFFGSPTTVWFVLTCAACAAALAWAPATISRRLRAAAIAGLVALPILHVAVHWGGISDHVAWSTNGVWLGLAGLVGISFLAHGESRTGRDSMVAASADSVS